MKQTLKIYLYTLLIIFIPFTLIALILALLSYFIQWNGFLFHSIIEVLSYLILVIAALYFTSRLSQKRLHHCLLIAFLYFLFFLLVLFFLLLCFFATCFFGHDKTLYLDFTM